jgi:arylformamidase
MQLQRQQRARSPLAVDASGEPWIDVTVPIRGGMLHWPGNPEVAVAQTEHLRRGDLATVSSLSLGVHTGTHVDAPVHFILNAAGVDTLPLDRLIGTARVLDMDEIGRIRPGDLEDRDIRAGERILFKTRNSRFWKDRDFRPDYTCLTPEGARWIVERGVLTVGIDYLSVAPMDEAPETHRPLLAAGICVIEGLDLSAVEPGLYDLICLPLRLEGLDGAPARVVLRKSWLETAPRTDEGRTS